MAFQSSSRPSRFFLLAAFALASLFAPQANAATFNVRSAPYNATGNGMTDDFPAIEKAIKDAIAAGSNNTVLIPAGTYKIATSQTLGIANANGLTVEGESGTLLVAYTNADLLHVDTSSNVTIQMLTMDTKPMRFTQGTVNTLSADGKTLTVTLDAGFPLFTDAPITMAQEMVFWTDPNSIAYDRTEGGDGAFGGAKQLGNGTWSVTSNSALSTAVVGKKFVVWYAYQAAPWFANASGNTGPIAFTDITMYGAGGAAAIGMNRNSGPITLTRVVVGPPPGSNRLIAASGGFNAQGNSGTITFDSCDISHIQEDGLDIGGDLAHILDHPHPNQIVVENTQNYAVGDTVQLWNWTYQKEYVEDTAHITAASLDSNKDWDLTLDHAVTIVNTGAGPGDANWSEQEKDGIDRCIDLQAVGPLRMTSTRLQTSGRALNLKAPNTVIENSTFYDTPWGIFSAAETFWHGGPAPLDMTIRNNTFRNMGIAPIEFEVRYSVAPGSCQNIRVQGNVFDTIGQLVPWSDGVYGPQTDVRGGGVSLRNVKGALVADNRFIGNWGPPVFVENSESVQIENNAISGSDAHMWSDWTKYGIDMSKVIPISGSDQVTLSNDIVSDLGMYATGLSAAVTSTNVTGLTTGIAQVPSIPPAAGIVAWFKADAIFGITDAEALTTWTDSSAMGHYAAQATANQKPVYGAKVVGGEPAVEFDATRSTSFTFANPLAADFSVMLVFQGTQGSGTGTSYANGAGLLAGGTGGTGPGFGISLGADGHVSAGIGTAAQSIASNSGYDDGRPHVVTFTRTQSTGALSLYVDGLRVATGTGSTDSFATASTVIMGAANATGGYFTGAIAEVRLYNGALQDAARAVDENVLIAKYGITPDDGGVPADGGSGPVGGTVDGSTRDATVAGDGGVRAGAESPTNTKSGCACDVSKLPAGPPWAALTALGVLATARMRRNRRRAQMRR